MSFRVDFALAWLVALATVIFVFDPSPEQFAIPVSVGFGVGLVEFGFLF